MNFDKLVSLILTETSGKRAWDWVTRFSLHHRIQGSPHFHEAAEELITELRKLNLDEIEQHYYPADGETANWEWFPPYSWEIKSGELWIIEPEKELLGRYDELPMSIVTHSKSCDVKAEVVDVGQGAKQEDYDEKDVKGKIVLLSGSPRVSHDLAIENGAIGLIIYPDAHRAIAYPGMTRYDGIWPNKENFEKVTFGFSISYAQALNLKDKLKKKKVTVHAKIDARLYKGDLEVVSAAIKGSTNSEEEIILIAHLCHPAASANDNASGSAGLLEIARSLRNLIERKEIEPPRRTIRFLWVPEFHGTIPYVDENKEKVRKAIACINLDMIGEDPVEIGFPFQVSGAPRSTPSILNDIIRSFTTIIADHEKGIAINGTKMPMRYRIGPFAGGSDHLIMADSYFGVPSVMFGHSDYFHHTSLDTTNVCDPTEMQRVIAIATGVTIVMASLDGLSIEQYWDSFASGYYQRLANANNLLNELALEIKVTEEEGQLNEKTTLGLSIIENTAIYEKKVVESLKLFGEPSLEVELLIDLLIEEINQWRSHLEKSWKDRCTIINSKVDFKIKEEYLEKYSRSFEGPLSFKPLALLAKEKSYQSLMRKAPSGNYAGLFFELMNLVGQKKTIMEIAAMLSLEYAKVFSLSEIRECMEILVEKEIAKKA
ncbi:MAG: DUF4910 domain-containing protein [Candidatus Kariarchaeaceae archaeon]